MEPEFFLAVFSAAIGLGATTSTSELLNYLKKRIQKKKGDPERDKVSEFNEATKKIESARKNIDEFLSSLGDMTTYVEKVRGELSEVSDEVKKASNQKENLEKRIKSLDEIKKHDEDTVRDLFGIPSKSQQRWTRWRGFAEGVAASLIASVIFTFGPNWYEESAKYFSNKPASTETPGEKQ